MNQDSGAKASTVTWRRLLLFSAIASGIVWLIPCVLVPLVGPPRLNSAYLNAATVIVSVLAPFQPLYEALLNRVLFIYSAHGTPKTQMMAWSPFAFFNTAAWFLIAATIAKVVALVRGRE